ncbi:hypothetical protein [Burkholderia gladioli]|nr:hypothetical protein [Burkholderia gladioli]
MSTESLAIDTGRKRSQAATMRITAAVAAIAGGPSTATTPASSRARCR